MPFLPACPPQVSGPTRRPSIFAAPFGSGSRSLASSIMHAFSALHSPSHFFRHACPPLLHAHTEPRRPPCPQPNRTARARTFPCPSSFKSFAASPARAYANSFVDDVRRVSLADVLSLPSSAPPLTLHFPGPRTRTRHDAVSAAGRPHLHPILPRSPPARTPPSRARSNVKTE